MLGLEAVEVAAIAAALSALAAWVSAWNSRQAVARAHRPFVYGEPEIRTDKVNLPGQRLIAVRLRNDGAGVALDVRFRLEAEDGRWQGDPLLPVRAMRPGEVAPPEPDHRDHPMLSSQRKTGFEMAAPPRSVEAWAAVIRFSDSAGQHWEVLNRRHPPGPLMLRKARSGRFDVWRGRLDW